MALTMQYGVEAPQLAPDLVFRAVYTGTRSGLTPAIRAGKGWRGRRELAPRCSATQLGALRRVAGQTPSCSQSFVPPPPPKVETHSFSRCEVRCRLCGFQLWYLHVVASPWRTRWSRSKAAGATIAVALAESNHAAPRGQKMARAGGVEMRTTSQGYWTLHSPRRQPRSVSWLPRRGAGRGGGERGEGGGAERREASGAPPRHSLFFLVPGEEGREAGGRKRGRRRSLLRPLPPLDVDDNSGMFLTGFPGGMQVALCSFFRRQAQDARHLSGAWCA